MSCIFVCLLFAYSRYKTTNEFHLKSFFSKHPEKLELTGSCDLNCLMAAVPFSLVDLSGLHFVKNLVGCLTLTIAGEQVVIEVRDCL